MFTVTESFITKHGIDLKNFKLYIEGVSFNCHTYGNFSHSLGEYPEEMELSNGHRSLSYRVAAYASENGAASGDLGIPVILPSGESTFQVTNFTTLGTMEETLELCQSHFRTLL